MFGGKHVACYCYGIALRITDSQFHRFMCFVFCLRVTVAIMLVMAFRITVYKYRNYVIPLRIAGHSGCYSSQGNSGHDVTYAFIIIMAITPVTALGMTVDVMLVTVTVTVFN